MVAALDPAVVGGAIHAAMDIGERDVTETVGDVSRAANTGNLDVAVVVADRKIAANIPSFDTPKRSCDICRGGIRQSDRAIAARNGCGTLNISGGDATETIAYLESTLYVRHLNGAVVVAHGDISAGPGEFDAAKSIVPPTGAGITDVYRAVAVLNVCSSVNA